MTEAKAISANPGRIQQGAANFNPSTTDETHLNGEWQQVTSKRSRKLRDKTSHQAPRRFSTQVHPAFNKAIRENRCFRCLAIGHQRAQCKQLRDKTSHQATRKFSTQVHPAFNTAIRENRCFRCLAIGHQRAQCRDPPKCFKCHQSGHYSSNCKLPIKPNVTAKPNTHTKQSKLETHTKLTQTL